MAEVDSSSLERVIAYVRSQRGIDLSAYKETSLRRRLARRIQAVGASGYEDYLDRLQASPDEFDPLFETLFINVTQFFRDPESWDVIRDTVIPRILNGKSGTDAIRVWCAGTASGEEAYSIAMLVADALGDDAFRERVKIYATDIDEVELNRARLGTFSADDLERVPEAMRSTYFESGPTALSFRSDLRHSIIFGRHNLLEDAPISRLDLLICRNTLMYFNRAAQNRIMARFHFALRSAGFLFLGRAELLLTRRNLFAAIDQPARIFTKVAQARNVEPFLPGTDGDGDHRDLLAGVRIRDLAFDHSPLPQLVVDTRGVLALANRAALSHLRLMGEDIGKPFRDLDLSFRPVELRGPIEEAISTGRTVMLNGIKRARRDGGPEFFDIRISAVPGGEGGPVAAAIAFLDVTDDHDLRSQLERTNGALETAYEELQSTNEELETTNEELQSTIEELETTNEEFQSTNEELETMNEELQSSNDEVRGVNQELRDRNETITRLNAYMRSILDSLQMGVVVLDQSLKVELWNAEATELWGLRGDEVAGQPFLNLEIGLPVAQLKDSLHLCLRSGSSVDPIALAAHNRRGRRITCRVNCAPLLGPQSEVSGAILIMEEWHGTRTIAGSDGGPSPHQTEGIT